MSIVAAFYKYNFIAVVIELRKTFNHYLVKDVFLHSFFVLKWVIEKISEKEALNTCHRFIADFNKTQNIKYDCKNKYLTWLND